VNIGNENTHFIPLKILLSVGSDKLSAMTF
jgi:hypothetical protein